jgi:hypothetical protein
MDSSSILPNTVLDSQDEVKNERTASFACIAWMILFGYILFFVLAVAYAIFGVIFLVRDSNVCGRYSPLWVFSLVALVFRYLDVSFLRLILKSQGRSQRQLQRKKREKVIFFLSIVILAIELMILSWGSMLLRSSGMICEDMTHTGLYYWALICISISIVSIVLLSIYWLSMCQTKTDDYDLKSPIAFAQDDEAQPLLGNKTDYLPSRTWSSLPTPTN